MSKKDIGWGILLVAVVIASVYMGYKIGVALQ